MNGSEAGDVNPYFACMAALGLWQKQRIVPSRKQRKKLSAGIWTGIPGFCWKQMGKWESTGKRVENLFIKKKVDSEDGYLGMYLFLMGKYLEKTENTDLPEYWKKGISLALKRFKA